MTTAYRDSHERPAVNARSGSARRVDEIGHAFLRTPAPDDGRGRRTDELQTVDVDATVGVARGEVELRAAGHRR